MLRALWATLVLTLLGAPASASLLNASLFATMMGTQVIVVAGPPVVGATMVADLTVSRPACTAPCVIFGNLIGSTSSAVAHSVLMTDGVLLHDYGDPGKGNWEHGLRSTDPDAEPHDKNEQQHFLGAHVYLDPGTYDYVGSVSYGANSDTDTKQIEVSAFSGTTWCFDTDADPSPGSDGCPGGSNHAQISDADQALASSSYCNVDDATNVRCLFRRGRTFTLDTEVVFDAAGERFVAGYGDGPKYVIDGSSMTGDLFSFTDSHRHIVFSDMSLQGNVSAASQHCLDVPDGEGPQHVSFVDSEILYCDSLIEARHNNAPVSSPTTNGSNGNLPRYWAFFNTDLRYSAGNGGVSAFMTIEDAAFVGGMLADMLLPPGDVDTGEHTGRCKTCRRVLFTAYDLGWWDRDGGLVEGREVVGCCFRNDNNPGNSVGCDNESFGGTVFTWRNGLARSSIDQASNWSEYNVMDDIRVNKCRDSNREIEIAATGGGTPYVNEHHRFYVLSDMMFTANGNTNTGSGGYLLVENTEHFVAQNIIMDATEAPGSLRGIQFNVNCLQQELGDLGTAMYTESGDGHVRQYTFYQNTNTASTRIGITGNRSDISGSPSYPACSGEWDLSLDGALAYEPDGSVTIIDTANFQSTSCCGGSCPGSCNVEPGSAPFTYAAPITLADFEPASTTPPDPVDAVTCADPTALDARGCEREATGGSCDAGAVDSGATCTPVPGTPGALFSCATGDWSDPDTWDNDIACASVGDGPPDALDTVVVQSGDTVTLDLASQSTGPITVESGATLAASSPEKILDLYGDADFSSTALPIDDQWITLRWQADADLRAINGTPGWEVGALDLQEYDVDYYVQGGLDNNQDANVDQIRGNGGSITVVCGEETSGTCPDQTAFEFSLDSGGVANGCITGTFGTGILGDVTIANTAVQIESFCGAGIGYMRPFTTGTGFLQFDFTLGAGGGNKNVISFTDWLAGASMTSDECVFQKGGDAHLGGGTWTCAGGANPFRIGNGTISAGGYHVAVYLDGADLTTDYFRFDPDEPVSQQAELYFNAAGSIVTATATTPAFGTQDVFVSAAGNDANSGLSSVAPLLTFDAAIDVINGFGEGSYRILLRDGDTFDERGETWQLITRQVYVGKYVDGADDGDPGVILDCGDSIMTDDDVQIYESVWECQ